MLLLANVARAREPDQAMADQVVFGSPGALWRGVQQSQSHVWALENPLCSLGVWVAKRRPALAGLTHPSSSLLSCKHLGGQETCASSQTAPAALLPRNWRGFYKACALLWHRQLLNVVVGCGTFGREEMARDRAWSLWFTLHNPTSCMQVLRRLGTCLPKDKPPFSQYQSLTATSRAC